jgi:hypothetical protein
MHHHQQSPLLGGTKNGLEQMGQTFAAALASPIGVAAYAAAMASVNSPSGEYREICVTIAQRYLTVSTASFFQQPNNSTLHNLSALSTPICHQLRTPQPAPSNSSMLAACLAASASGAQLTPQHQQQQTSFFQFPPSSQANSLTPSAMALAMLSPGIHSPFLNAMNALNTPSAHSKLSIMGGNGGVGLSNSNNNR